MILYHGTSTTFLDKIFDEGLLPRSLPRTKRRKGNWQCESVNDHIYLTDAYALHYAGAAVANNKGKRLILEIEADNLDLFGTPYPDEDFLAQAFKAGAFKKDEKAYEALAGKTLLECTRYFAQHISEYQHVWRTSLGYLGNVAHCGIIPTNAIKRFAVIEPGAPIIFHSDPTISVANYRVMADYYRKLSKHVFDPQAGASSCPVYTQSFSNIHRAGIVVTDLRGTPPRFKRKAG